MRILLMPLLQHPNRTRWIEANVYDNNAPNATCADVEEDVESMVVEQDTLSTGRSAPPDRVSMHASNDEANVASPVASDPNPVVENPEQAIPSSLIVVLCAVLAVGLVLYEVSGAWGAIRFGLAYFGLSLAAFGAVGCVLIWEMKKLFQ